MQVSAKLNNYRKSPRKVRLVARALRGLDTGDAEARLKFLIKGSAPDFEKLIRSAVANAENNLGLDKDNLFIKDIIVNEGPKLKRWLPRAHGRATLILKRTSNIEVILAEKVEGKKRREIPKKQEIKDVKPEELKEKEEKGEEEKKEEKKEIFKEKEEKEFVDEKKKAVESRGFLKRIFRRKSM